MNTFTYRFEKYNKFEGISYEIEDNMIVKISSSGEECTLSGNREGLIALAKTLIKLADEEVPIGSHFHLDASVFLEEGSSDLIIEKI